MKLFITGATGVIGSRAIPMLEAAGHEVTPLRRNRVSLFDPAALARAVAGHDVVINLATHIPSSSMKMLLPGAWKENDRIRTTGSRNLVDAALAAGVKRFIQESFAPAYPDRGEAWIDETTPLDPVRYNRSIVDAEASAERFTLAGGIGVVLRFGGFYGPDAFQTRDMIAAVRRGWVPMPSAPDAFISSISHDDAATAVVAALTARAGVYNIADDEPVTRREYFDSLARVLGVPSPRIAPAWMGKLFGSLGRLLARSERISNRKFREETGWAPKNPSVREGWKAAIT